MRYAIFSDIHGNRPAWEAVVADMEKRDVQVLVCLGDVVGYGPCPQEVLRDVRSRTTNLVLGNHEAAAAGLLDSAALNPFARQTIEWTQRQLDEESLQFISKLPLSIDHGPVLFVHAEAAKPSRFGYINDLPSAQENFAATRHHLTFVGHTHLSAIFRLDENGVVEQLPDEDCILNASRRYIVNVGSVGEPRRADDLRAHYVIYDDLAHELYFRRVAFDLAACRADLSASGLEITPWFLTVADQPRVPEAAPALAQAPAAPVASRPGAGPEIQQHQPAVSAGAQGQGHPPATATPMVARPVPLPRRRRSRAAAALVLVSVLAVLAVIGGLIAFRFYYKPDESTADAESPPTTTKAESPPAEPGPVAGPEDSLPGEPDPVPVEPVDPDPPLVAVVPDPADDPSPEPEPEPSPAPADPAPKPAPGKALPIPPAPANAAAIRLAEGLMFYAPLDEDESELSASDKSSGGRDLDIASALPGSLGQVGMACQLEEGGTGMASEATPLPALPGITISIWIRHPGAPETELPPDDEPVSTDEKMILEEKEGVAKEPALPAWSDGNLISIKDYCEVRLEGGAVVANLDRKDAEARLDLPLDKRWHHILVSNGEGTTTIWIDHGSQSPAVGETLAPVPGGNAAVVIGGGAGNFFVDEVAIWNRRFTPEERQLLYRLGRLGEPIMSPARALAYWSFDEKLGARLFDDLVGEHALGSYKSWRSVKGIAPDPIPFTRKANPHAAQIWHLAESTEEAGSFQMKPNLPFTYEGWFRLGTNSTGTLGGTISAANEEKMPGWRVAPAKDKSGKGMLAFLYESGATRVQALGADLPVYNGLPHHFAAVWNPMGSPTHGSMDLYLDNEKVATASLPLAALGSVSDQPFRIVARGSPFILDEVRFTSGALKPDAFLTGGMAGSAGPAPEVATKDSPKGESILQRRDREMRERKAQKNK